MKGQLTDFCSASFPSLPVTHGWWRFLKENKAVAQAKERLGQQWEAGSKPAPSASLGRHASSPAGRPEGANGSS